MVEQNKKRGRKKKVSREEVRLMKEKELQSMTLAVHVTHNGVEKTGKVIILK